MKVVFKYEVEFGPDAQIEIQSGARFLHVDVHAGSVWVWALVDPQEELRVRPIGYFNTGDRIPSEWQHIGSFASSDDDKLPPGCRGEGYYVGHVFGV